MRDVAMREQLSTQTSKLVERKMDKL